MRRTLVALGMVSMLLIPSAAYAADTNTVDTSASVSEAGVEIGGNYGPRACYVEVDYFRIDVGVQPTRPYVDLQTQGSIGAGVHCPLDDLTTYLQNILASEG